MKVGDIVRSKTGRVGELGLFVGLRTFEASKKNPYAEDYTCVEVMWFGHPAVPMIQSDLIECVYESDIEVVKEAA